MVTETRDRRINTSEKMRNDGAKRLPHERDETPDAQDVQSRGIMRQAADDLEQGLVDTDLHGVRGVETAVESTGSGQAHPHSDAANGMRDRPATRSKTTRE
jgi:hypothetical protein